MKSCETQSWRHLAHATSLEQTRNEEFEECGPHVVRQFGNVCHTTSPRNGPADTKSLVVCGSVWGPAWTQNFEWLEQSQTCVNGSNASES